MNSSKELQGDQLLAEGDKLVTKTFWRWSEDWEGAAIVYEKAATAYKNAKQNDKCKQAYIKAANAQARVNMLHSAGKNFENAADIALSNKQVPEAVKLYRDAAELFSENGTVERGGDSLAKAAKAMETEDPEEALNLYLEVVDKYEGEETGQRKAVETLKKAVNFVLTKNNLEAALKLLEKQVELQSKAKQKNELFKAYLCIVVVHLARNDYVAAGKAYDSYLSTEGFTHSKECLAGGKLLDAVENGSPEGLKACISDQIYTFLPNQVTKLARDLTLSGAASSSGRSEKGSAALPDDEDDLSGLL